MKGPVALFALAGVALAMGTGPTRAAPKPRHHSKEYDLDILGFNDGGPYRLRGAAAEAVLADPGAVVFRFASQDWLQRKQAGTYISVSAIASRFPNRPAYELFAVYGIDRGASHIPEMLIIADAKAIGDGKRYAPTVLGLGKRGGYRPLWAATTLPGQRYHIEDIRDLNGDGSPELLIEGVAGKSGYYEFHEVVGRRPGGFRTLLVKPADSLHYVDLNRAHRIEIVVRHRFGRRGPPHLWTYVSHLYEWSGRRFIRVDKRFPRYHDEATLPGLISELIDDYDAKRAILEEKIDAIESVRAEVLTWTRKRPADFGRRLVRALAALQKDRLDRAARMLKKLQRAYPYEPQVLLGLAEVDASHEHYRRVLDDAIRTLTIAPRSRRAWWWAGVALVQLEERSSAVASFHNLVRLCGPQDAGLAFLRARRGEPGMDGRLQQVIDQTIADFSK